MVDQDQRALVIGCGNPLRRDDALGIIAARRLGEILEEDRAEILADHQLTPEMAEAVSRASFVLFLDASELGIPGEMREIGVFPQTEDEAFSHHLDPPALLAYACRFYGRAAPAVSLMITGEDFGFGEGLSATVEDRLPELVQRAAQIIMELSPASAGSTCC